MTSHDTTAGVRATRGWPRKFIVPLAGATISALLVGLAQSMDPLHRRGLAQGPLGVLIGVGSVLEAPVRLLLAPVAALGFFAIVPLIFLFYFCCFYLLGRVNRSVSRRIDARQPAVDAEGPAGKVPPTSPGRVTRRRLLLGAKRAIASGAVVTGAYPVLAEPHRLDVTRRTFPLRGLSSGLDGLRVVQIADIHHGPWTSIARVRRIIDVTNELTPDLIVLNGDYILRHADYAAPVAAELARLRAKVGVVGVLGNHDWWIDGPLCRDELTRAGVRMIDNDRLFVTPDRKLADASDEGLCVAGVGDLWTDRQLYDRALGGVPGEMPRLLLSHNPDVAEDPAFVGSGYRVDLMLSGHTHGGQVRLPVVGSPVTMSRYGQKYVRGLVPGPVCPVLISRGLGMAVLPVRLGSIPEIAVIELRRV